MLACGLGAKWPRQYIYNYILSRPVCTYNIGQRLVQIGLGWVGQNVLFPVFNPGKVQSDLGWVQTGLGWVQTGLGSEYRPIK